MKVEISNGDSKVEINVGISLMIAATDKLRELEKASFEYAIAEIGKSPGVVEKSQPAIIGAVSHFLNRQILTDSSVAEFLRTWDGRIFAVVHGTKNKYTEEQARELFDGMSAEDYEKFIFEIDCIIDGREQTEIKRDRVNIDLKLQKIRRQKEQSILTSEEESLQRSPATDR